MPRKIAATIYQSIIWIPSAIVPPFVKRRCDTERFSVDRFVYDEVAPKVSKDDIVLDAGAGVCQFKHLFSHAQYEATDFDEVFHEEARQKLDFYCSLDDIPKEDNTYTVVLNTQVLEHVEYPQKVIDELFRVLKPGGRLYLSTNHMFPVHHAPYNFYFFTRFGLKSLFENAGFEKIEIKERGGFFWLMAKILHIAPQYLWYQICYDGYRKYSEFQPKMQRPLLALVLLPLYVPSILIFGYLIPFLFFYLDPLDRQKDMSLGYACVAVKPKK